MSAQPEQVVEALDEAVDHVRGPSAGRVILAYGDYECPYSRQAFRAMEHADELGLELAAIGRGREETR